MYKDYKEMCARHRKWYLYGKKELKFNPYQAFVFAEEEAGLIGIDGEEVKEYLAILSLFEICVDEGFYLVEGDPFSQDMRDALDSAYKKYSVLEDDSDRLVYFKGKYECVLGFIKRK